MSPTSQLSRRSLMRGALATGGLYALDSLFTCERTNAAAVGPNDKIKITKVETFVLKNSWVFLKISTDAGISGWGEMLKDDAKACAAGAMEAANYLVGQDPLFREKLWHGLNERQRLNQATMVDKVLCAVDLALWTTQQESWSPLLPR